MVTVNRRPVGLSAVKLIHSELDEVGDLGRQMADVQRNSNPFGQGAPLTLNFAAANTLKVVHKLGRVPNGFIVTRIFHPSATIAPLIERDRDSKTISLYCAVACNFEIWVF